MKKINAAIEFKKNDSKKKMKKVIDEIQDCCRNKSKIKVPDVAFKCNVSVSFIYKNEELISLIRAHNKKYNESYSIEFISKKDRKTIETLKSKYDTLKSECKVLKDENTKLKDEAKLLRNYIEKLQSQNSLRVVK